MTRGSSGGALLVGSTRPPLDFRVMNSPGNAFLLTNCVAVNKHDFKDGLDIIINSMYVYKARVSPEMNSGEIGANALQRTFARLLPTMPAQVAEFDLKLVTNKQSLIESMTATIDFAKKSRATNEEYDVDELAHIFTTLFQDQILQPGQPIFMDVRGINFTVVVQSVRLMLLLDAVPLLNLFSKLLADKGILTKSTNVTFSSPSGLMHLKNLGSGGARADAIIAPDFLFEQMGIGGLGNEFSAIFRRAFALRILSPDLVSRMGLKHVKGLLLYGPPGTGKTLIARQIGKMLNVREPKIVNGPEILSKYVGLLEENIRNLFVDAEAEYKSKGESLSLHIIIFDELDSVFKQRGLRGDGTGVGDNVVNQLLSKMDGVDQLNNILIIGMTNRLDLIDNALLRPGRFEVQLEILLPDEEGREEIFKIQTKKMADNNILDRGVDFKALAARTKNFTGAEIEGLVKLALSFAIQKHISVGLVAALDDDVKNIKVTMSDFEHALSEVKPAFGASDEDMLEQMPYGIIPFLNYVDEVLQMGNALKEQVRTTETEKLVLVLLYGPAASGKTALAAKLARNTEFPFVRMLLPEAMVGMLEPARIQYIDGVFRDVYKSPLSVLVVDNIERIINYVPIGPRFLNDVLQLLLVNLTRKPPHGRRLLIIATTLDHRMLALMNALLCFTKEIPVPELQSVQELHRVMASIGAFSDSDRKRVVQKLEHDNPDKRFRVGIKRVLGHLDTAKYHQEHPVETLILLLEDCMVDTGEGFHF